jgi:hypothetical protein
MNYRKYLSDNLPPVDRAILETLILQYENHLKKLKEDKSLSKEDLILYLRVHYKIFITERKLREKIRTMFTKKHIPVGGHSGKTGYFLLDEDEVERIANEDRSRCKHLIEHAHAGKKILADLGGQQKMGV